MTCNPKERITASQALDHDYFWTDPLPADPKTYVSTQRSLIASLTSRTGCRRTKPLMNTTGVDGISLPHLLFPHRHRHLPRNTPVHSSHIHICRNLSNTVEAVHSTLVHIPVVHIHPMGRLYTSTTIRILHPHSPMGLCFHIRHIQVVQDTRIPRRGVPMDRIDRLNRHVSRTTLVFHHRWVETIGGIVRSTSYPIYRLVRPFRKIAVVSVVTGLIDVVMAIITTRSTVRAVAAS